MSVATCESSLDPEARNGPNVGLFQVNAEAHPQWTVAQLLDPETNIAAAYLIWRDSGGNWSAWSCKP